LQPQRAALSDSCSELIATYLAVRDDPRTVLSYLRGWKPDPDFYYRIRSRPSPGRLKHAAEFIYLNRMCWNGLYRVNAAGSFNVPYGRPKTDYPMDEPNVLACAKTLAMRGVTIECEDFEHALTATQPGDLVFLDPPYVTGHNNNGFVDYNEVLFAWRDQQRLATLACNLASKGAHVVVTNAAHADVLALYPGFSKTELRRTSTIASSAKRRGPVAEALIWSVHG
jgi:DNA adenine methylase